MKLSYTYNNHRTPDRLIVDQVIVVRDANGEQSHNHNHAALTIHKEGNITKAGNYSRRTIEIEISICNPEGSEIEYKRVYSHKKAWSYIKQNLLTK